jgi:hypothetical protein
MVSNMEQKVSDDGLPLEMLCGHSGRVGVDFHLRSRRDEEGKTGHRGQAPEDVSNVCEKSNRFFSAHKEFSTC